MIEITDEDKGTALADLKEFVNEVARGLAAAPPLPKLGDPVPADEVICQHSESLCEDGQTVLRLFDLRDGRTGAQSFPAGEAPGPVRYC